MKIQPSSGVAFELNEKHMNNISTPTGIPVINAILKIVKNGIFDDCLFVCAQHLLYTTVDLLDGLIYLGAKPQRIFLLGKPYSTNPHVFHFLSSKGINVVENSLQKKYGYFLESFDKDVKNAWSNVKNALSHINVTKIIVLDDGGVCLSNVPPDILENYLVFGVEQTSSGLVRVKSTEFPLIEVASSAIKQYIEPPMIANALKKKLENILPLNKKKLKCSVIGLGVIGKAVIEMLAKLGHDVYSYDNNTTKNISISNSKKLNSIQDAIFLSDYIFGCAGEDILKGVDIKSIVKTSKTFISCSSQDKEFQSLLIKYSKSISDAVINPLKTIEFKLNDSVILKILLGGFPANFDSSGYSVQSNDIQVTRSILLAALIQGATITDHYNLRDIPRNIMLSPLLQYFVMNEWKSLNSTADYIKKNPIIEKFNNIEWIIKNSGGSIFGESEIDCLLN